MAKDVAPEMISSIQNRFQNSYQNSNTIQSLLKKVEAGTATYSEAYQYAQEVSKLTNSAYSKSVTSSTLPDGTMYYNIASRVIPETLEESYELVSSYSAQVQTSLNQSAGIGLKAKTASEDEDRISGIVDLASSAKNYSDVAQEVASTMENYTENIVDRTIEDNVDFQGSCGMTPKVTRIADSGCCEWCSALAGTYSYPTISRDVYRRHLNCHCTAIYDPGTGKVQDVHTKRWTDADEVDKIEARKKIGLNNDNRKNIATARKIESLIKCEKASYPPQTIDTSNLTVDAEHMKQRHDVSEQEAISYITDAKFSVTRWQETFEDYFGDNGAAYVNVITGEVRTAFKSEDYSENAKRAMEAINNG